MLLWYGMVCDAVCYICHKPGHIAKGCTAPGGGGSRGGGASSDGCFNCGKSGHMARDCRLPQRAHGSGRSTAGAPHCCKLYFRYNSQLKNIFICTDWMMDIVNCGRKGHIGMLLIVLYAIRSDIFIIVLLMNSIICNSQRVWCTCHKGWSMLQLWLW
jgi:hypothetical protein